MPSRTAEDGDKSGRRPGAAFHSRYACIIRLFPRLPLRAALDGTCPVTLPFRRLSPAFTDAGFYARLLQHICGDPFGVLFLARERLLGLAAIPLIMGKALQ